MTRKAVCNGILDLPGMSIPIKVYLGFDAYTIDGHTYHDGCDAKVYQYNQCEDHPDLEFPPTYSAVDYGDQKIRIETKVRDELLERKAKSFIVKSSHKISELADLMSTNRLISCGVWEAVPVQTELKIATNYEQYFSIMLQRMLATKTFLLVEMPLAGLKRYCILMPIRNGHSISCNVYPLLYAEELRATDGVKLFDTTGYATKMDAILKELQRPFPKLTMKPIQNKVEAWFLSHAPKVIVATKKKIGAVKQKQNV